MTTSRRRGQLWTAGAASLPHRARPARRAGGAGGSLYGIHTERALENFPLAGRPVHPELVHAYGAVKLACARTNRALGAWADDPAKADAIERACREMIDGGLDEHVVVDACRAAPAPAPT